jgi:glycosyltransferase involved in cell wall biosynthesis
VQVWDLFHYFDTINIFRNFLLKIAIITTHPIQYNAPLFKYLSDSGEFDIKVFYTWSQSVGSIHDKDFGIQRKWDIDLLSGYDHEFVENISSNPGSHHFNGIVNPTLNKRVEAFTPDAIILYGWKFNSHLKLMRHFHGRVPIIFRGDSTLLDEAPGFSLKKFFRFTILKWVYRYVDLVFSPGRSSDAYFKACGLSNQQIIRVPHAIDNDRFMSEYPIEESTDNRSYTQQASVWRRSLGISDDHKVFLFAGKLEPKKDPELLIKAFFKLLQHKKDIHLIIVGSGILEEKLKQLVTDLTNSLTPDLCRLTSDSCHLTSDF